MKKVFVNDPKVHVIGKIKETYNIKCAECNTEKTSVDVLLDFENLRFALKCSKCGFFIREFCHINTNYQLYLTSKKNEEFNLKKWNKKGKIVTHQMRCTCGNSLFYVDINFKDKKVLFHCIRCEEIYGEIYDKSNEYTFSIMLFKGDKDDRC